MELKNLKDCPQYLPAAAAWFNKKWGVPQEAYIESMRESLAGARPVPQWYVVLDEHGAIAAGAGIIENDFHSRKDLAPNLCALYVEQAFRGRGLARRLLNRAREDMARCGVSMLYLITDHTAFYEKCGWHFLTAVSEDCGGTARLYAAPTSSI